LGHINSFSQAIADECPLDITEGVYSAKVAALNAQLKASLEAKYSFPQAPKWPGIVSLLLLVLIFILGLVSAYCYFNFVVWISLVLIAASVLLHTRIAAVIKAYRPAGNDLETQVAGFKMYLNATDHDRRNFINAPELSTALYEKYLPYSIALGLENAWGTLFKDTIATAINNNTYTPTVNYVGWGRGHYNHFYNSLFYLSMANSLYASSIEPVYTNSGSDYSGSSGSSDYSSDSSSFDSDSYDSSSDSDSGFSDDGGGGGGGDGF